MNQYAIQENDEMARMVRARQETFAKSYGVVERFKFWGIEKKPNSLREIVSSIVLNNLDRQKLTYAAHDLKALSSENEVIEEGWIGVRDVANFVETAASKLSSSEVSMSNAQLGHFLDELGLKEEVVPKPAAAKDEVSDVTASSDVTVNTTLTPEESRLFSRFSYRAQKAFLRLLVGRGSG